jgi:hypothetical protein
LTFYRILGVAPHSKQEITVNILAAIRREERKLEKRVGKLRQQLEGLTAAARVLGNSAAVRLDNAQKRVMSAAAGRAKISAAMKRRWAKVRAGASQNAAWRKV